MKHLKTFESISISNKDLDDYANMSKVQKYKEELLFKSYVDLLFKHKDKWDYIYDSYGNSTFYNLLSSYGVETPDEMMKYLLKYGSTKRNNDLLQLTILYYNILKDTLIIEPKIQELIDVGLIVRFGRDSKSDTKYLIVEVFHEDYETLSTDKVLEIFEALIFIKVRLDFRIASITPSEIAIEIKDIK